MVEEKNTDFGYQTVARAEKTSRVREVFDNVAKDYDLMNDLMSGGMHRLWKNAFVTWARPRDGQKVLDLAGGTGDIAFRLLRAADLTVTICDINADMLAVGQARADNKALAGDALEWVCGDGEALPFEDDLFDLVTISFGIRNVTDKEAALAEIFRVLKPGGRFLCLEFSKLALPGLSGIYDNYSFNIVPRIGRYVAKDEAAYRYLVESIRIFPDQDRFAAMIEAAGFAKPAYENLSGGIAAMHSAWKT